jgi:hypothetical protein
MTSHFFVNVCASLTDASRALGQEGSLAETQRRRDAETQSREQGKAEVDCLRIQPRSAEYQQHGVGDPGSIYFLLCASARDSSLKFRCQIAQPPFR